MKNRASSGRRRAGVFTSRSIALALAAVLAPARARASEPASACAGTPISVEEGLDARWRDPVAHLCEQFAAMKGTDPSARLRIAPAGPDVDIEASLGPARVTHRRVHSPDDLLTVVEALTMVIPEARSEPIAPAARPLTAASETPPAVNSKPPERTDTDATAPKQTSARGKGSSIGVELGLALEGRLSGSPAYLSLGGAAYAGLRPDDWFFALVARWQPSEVPASGPQAGFEMESAGAGFVVARRFVKSPVVGVDAGASVLVVVDTLSDENRTPDEVGTDTAARFGILVRALVGASSWKLASSLDADVAPARVGRTVRVDPALPPLPAWSIALGLGAAWTEP